MKRLLVISLFTLAVGLCAVLLVLPLATRKANEGHTQESDLQHEPSADAEASGRDNQLGPSSPSLVTRLGQEVEWTRKTPAAHRARTVDISQALLTANESTFPEGHRFRIDLFDGEYVEASVVRAVKWGRSEATFSARAEIPGDPHGYVVLSVVNGFTRILIKDSLNHRVYQVRYDVGRESHLLLEVDRAGSDIIECLTCAHADAVADEPSALEATNTTPLATNESGLTTVDLMVVYTPAALDYEQSEANMQLNISQAVALANQVHANSLTELEFNLVHSALVDYTETSSGTFDLNSIMEPADGRIDIVHDLRKQYGADFVSFFVRTDSFGGLAYRNRTYDRPDRAFSIVRVQQSDTTSYTTVHEISHNMGNGHSKTQRVQPFNEVGVATYAAGWQWADSDSPATVGYCSVMTYEDFDSSGADEYVRVAHLSNPDITYEGNPTGHPEDGDAARVVREGRAIYEAFAEPQGPPRFSSFPYQYGFEEGEPDWMQTFDDVHDWSLRQSGGTPSIETGPEGGAYAGNRYAYVEASEHRSEEARLTAEFDFTTLSSVVMDFAYHMYDATGFYMGSLELEASQDGGESWESLWSRSGSQGIEWQETSVDLSTYAGRVIRLRFRGFVGTGFRSDIALDSIRIEGTPEADGPASYADWIDLFPGLTETSMMADADRDGLSNFLEYALGLSPETPESSADVWTHELNEDGSRFELRFLRARGSVLYEVQSLPQLGDWSSAETIWRSDTATDLVEVGQTQSISIDVSGSSLFLRLRVSE